MRTTGPLGYNSRLSRPFLVREQDHGMDVATQQFLVKMRRDELETFSKDYSSCMSFIGEVIMLSAVLTEAREFEDAGKALDEAIDLLRQWMPRLIQPRLHPGAERILEAICIYNASVLFLELGIDDQGIDLLQEAGELLDGVGSGEGSSSSFLRTSDAITRLANLVSSRPWT